MLICQGDFNVKKLFIPLFAAALTISLAGCGGGSPSGTVPVQNTPMQSISVPSGNSDFSAFVTIVSPAPAAQLPVPTPGATPVPTPVPEYSVPSPVSDDAPQSPVSTPSPVPTPYVSSVRITKSPTSETVNAGGSARFIAYAENYTSIVWILVSPDARTSYNAAEGPAHFPGLIVTGQGTSDLCLSCIPAEMDKWRIQAYFTGSGEPQYTAGAYLTVTSPYNPGPEGNTEAYLQALAKQAGEELYQFATSLGYSVTNITNYTVSGTTADYNISFYNSRYTIDAEFQTHYDNTGSGSAPVRVNVYDAFHTIVRAENTSGRAMDYFHTILVDYS